MSMDKAAAVYELVMDHDDSRIESFVPNDPEPLTHGTFRKNRVDDFFADRPEGPDWTPPRLAPIWTPLPVRGRVRAWNDYPTMVSIVPVFSQRAVDALSDILEPNGELLPLVTKVGRYWAYNILTVADIVDVDRSVRYASSASFGASGVIDDFRYYEILPEKLSGLTIFRLRQRRGGAYVTRGFVDRARAAGLRGMRFDKIWPWPKGTFWKVEAKKAREAAKARDRRPALRRHTVVLRLATGRRSPTKVQREHVEAIMDALDRLLADPHAAYDAPVFGNLEGNEPVNGEHWLFLSCPDADQLVEAMRPFLRRLDWPGEVVLTKRYGEMRYEGAAEETVRGPW
jgi:hypothetical protein